MKQEWFCEGCCIGGTVTIPRHADLWQGVTKVSDHHAKKSVICNGVNGRKKIRVRVPGCSSQEWKQVRTSAREARHAE